MDVFPLVGDRSGGFVGVVACRVVVPREVADAVGCWTAGTTRTRRSASSRRAAGGGRPHPGRVGMAGVGDRSQAGRCGAGSGRRHRRNGGPRGSAGHGGAVGVRGGGEAEVAGAGVARRSFLGGAVGRLPAHSAGSRGPGPARPRAADLPGVAAEFGMDPVPAKVEALRSKAKRLVARGWLAERQPGRFTLAAGVAGPGGGS